MINDSRLPDGLDDFLNVADREEIHNCYNMSKYVQIVLYGCNVLYVVHINNIVVQMQNN